MLSKMLLIGEVHSQTAQHGKGAVPGISLILCAWLEKAGDDEGGATWYIQTPQGMRLAVPCSVSESTLLSLCPSRGIRVWVTGHGFLCSGMRLLIPLNFAFYIQYAAAQSVPVSLAHAIYRTRLQRVVNFAVRGEIVAQSLCSVHPLAYQDVDTLGRTCPYFSTDILACLLQVKNLRYTALATAPRPCLPSQMALGTTGLRYDIGKGVVEASSFYNSPPPGLPPTTPASCITLCRRSLDAFALIRALRTSEAPGTRFLIVAPKEAILTVVEELELDVTRDVVLSMRDLGNEAVNERLVTLTTLDFLCAGLRHDFIHDTYSIGVVLGWPYSVRRLEKKNVFLSAQFTLHVGFAMNCTVNPGDVFRALRIPESMAGCMDELETSIRRGIVHCSLSEGRTQEALAIKATQISMGSYSESEAALIAAASPQRVPRVLLFGDLCALTRQAFPYVQSGSTLPQHFAKRGIRVSPLVSSSCHFTECPICLNELDRCVVTHCGHRFCAQCLDRSLVCRSACPTCRAELGRDSVVALEPIIPQPEDLDRITLINFLRETLTKRVREGKRVVVALGWACYHERLASLLRKCGIRTCWAWHGNGQQILRNQVSFTRNTPESGTVLIVAPENPFLRWASFAGTDELVYITTDPRASGQCCKLRLVNSACGFPSSVYVATRGSLNVALPSFTPECLCPLGCRILLRAGPG